MKIKLELRSLMEPRFRNVAFYKKQMVSMENVATLRVYRSTNVDIDSTSVALFLGPDNSPIIDCIGDDE